ncbi:MAG TPA: ABC transporter permease [Vicinamibacterales bacterium]|nr:ABC transporter permease [Vicinamibacterales bacterium]
MLQNVFADFRYALRWLRRSPMFTFVAVASFSIGIGFNTALFTLVDALLFRPLPVEHPERLVDVYTRGTDTDPYTTSSYPDFLDIKNSNDVFTDTMAYSPSIDALKVGDRSRVAMGEAVTGNYFEVLGVRAHIGRTLMPEDDRAGAPRVAMISYRLWTREFGASNAVVGQSIRVHGQLYTVVGVAPREFTGMVPLLAPELWTPVAYVDEVEPGGMISTVPSPTGDTRLERRGTRWMFVKGRMRPGVTVDQAAANMRLIGARLQTQYIQTNKDRDLLSIATKDVHIHPMADRALLPIAMGLMVVVGLVLLIACANVASMLLARASGRQREIGIRLAVGASRARLIQQLVCESFVMAALGAAGGLGLAWLMTRAMGALALPIPIPLSFAVAIDSRVLLFATGVTFLAALTAGVAPAVKATRPNLVSELKGEAALAQSGGRRWALRDGLVAAQIAVTLVLLVTAGLLTRSLYAAQRVKIGFQSAGLAIVSTELNMIGYDAPKAKAFYDRAIDRVRAIPGVESVALAERLPFSINYNRNSIFLPDTHTANDKGLVVDVTRVSPEYFDTLGVPIVQGRNLASSDTPTSPKVAIVNEAFARKYWPNQNPIGKRIRQRAIDGPQYEVVGVSADYKISTVGEGATPYIHYALSQQPDLGEAIMARTRGDASAVVTAMRRELLAIDPNVLFLDQQTMDAQVAATLLPARAGAIAVGSVGVVAMVLAAIGLYGVIAYAVSRRTREIGIRMALGSRRADVIGMILGDGMRLTAIGAGVGAILAAGAAKAVAGALYGVSFADPLAWGAAIVALVTVALLANIVPALRASRISPSLALRSE